ncbi:MAG: CoA transferase [Pseudomonadota bacterium]
MVAHNDTVASMLSSVRVLDFSMFLAGPYCTRLMADLGAEVLKVEPPSGDFLRNAPPIREGHSTHFGHFNCGKKSVAVDLKTDRGRDLILALVERCDVLLENFRPGVMERLGLSYEDVCARKPDIIYCSVSGYGQSGPSAHLPAFAPVVHARSGHDLAAVRYNSKLDRPLANRNTTADILAALHALGAINAALFHRALTGAGQRLDVALMDTMHMMLAYEYQEAQLPSDGLPPLYRPLRTADGFLMIAPVSDQNFQALAETIGQPELVDDPRFQGGARFGNFEVLLEIAEGWSTTLPGREAESALLDNGCPCSIYQTIGESAAEAQVVYRGSAVTVHDAVGAFNVPNAPFQSAHTAIRAREWVAALGEHTEEVLFDLGMTEVEVSTLAQDGVIAGIRRGA